MQISFDQIMPVIETKISKSSSLQTAILAQAKAVSVVRDAQGLVRLLIEPHDNADIQDDDQGIQQLKSQLAQELGPYFGLDIWYSQKHMAMLRDLIDVIRRDRIPATWDDPAGLPRWFVLERHVAKHLWTRHLDQELPWPVEPVERGQRPAIVTFFSFKGGLGRTTALAGTAIALARKGHRVAMVDLDLEAPGLSSLFVNEDHDDSGVLDYLIEKRVQKRDWSVRPQIRQVNERAIVGDAGQPLRLLPAGRVDASYLEKLARVDFQHYTDVSLAPIVKEMLKELAAAVEPLDFIFLDARAGFHDLGGFALSSLSHGAVMLGSQSRQNWAGTTRAIELLAQPLDKEPVPVVLVHGMAPPLNQPGREQTLRSFRDQAYDVFQQNYYGLDDDIPNANDTDAPFMPIEILWQPELRGDILLDVRGDTPEERDRVTLLAKQLVASCEPISERVCRLFGRVFDKTGVRNGEVR